MKLENEKKKLIDEHEKEKKEILKEKMKVEDSLQTAIFKNKKLQVKDETFTGIFDCLKELLKKNTEFDNVLSNSIVLDDKDDKNESEETNVEDTHSRNIQDESMIYICTKCEFQSKRESILIEHMKVDHSPPQTKKVYVCDKCQYKCGTQEDFKKHCKEAHKDNNYTCDHCGKKLNSLYNLDNHIQMFHRKKDLSCERCDSKFSTAENVRKHLSHMHSIYEETSRKSYSYSYEEKWANGFCRLWNNSSCPYADNCKFLHEDAPDCHYKSRCRNISTCRFFHGAQSQGFQYREREFPPPGQGNQRRGNQ